MDSLAKARTSSSWLAHQRKPVDDALMKSIRWVPNLAIDLMESGQQRTKKKK